MPREGLPELLLGVERGEFPPADAGLSLFSPPDPRHSAVLGFTAHIAVVADVDPVWLDGQLRPGQLSEAFTPPFLGALASHLGRRVPAIDLVVLAQPAVGRPDIGLTPVTDQDHPRVRRALRYRTDVSVWAAREGVVILGRGFAGRWEVAVEVADEHQSRGVGRRLAAASRQLLLDDRPVWAQIAPGNAASVRAFLAAGFQPVGQEALLVTH